MDQSGRRDTPENEILIESYIKVINARFRYGLYLFLLFLATACRAEDSRSLDQIRSLLVVQIPLRDTHPLVVLTEDPIADAMPWFLGIDDCDIKAVEELDMN